MTPSTGNAVGRRIHVMGNSGAGKSTLGARLAAALDVPLVELDAINWQPGWIALVDEDPEGFEQLLRTATEGDAWVVAGSYTRHAQRAIWPRLETVVYLDLPVPQLVWRMLRRSWRRWRSRELLWGSNYEKFWPQLAIWRRNDSLLWWIVSQQRRKRDELVACMSDPAWSHIRFVRLTSIAEIEAFIRRLERQSGAACADRCTDR
jgi:adenylate kinase family enzyme